MTRVFAAIGALSGFMAVAAGAFGAHALQGRLPDGMPAIFETGARYQMYHALALLAVAWAAGRRPERVMRLAGWFFIAGMLLFCGSLYLLALTGARWMGAVTPLGGMALLLGWLCLAWGVWKQERPGSQRENS